MEIAAVVGANWGDEGKGRIVDALAGECDYVVRFQGGGNAGHTVINDLGRFVLHVLPCGAFYPHVTNVIAPGVALDLLTLERELEGLRSRGVPQPKLAVSDRAGLLFPQHRRCDALEEERLAGRAFGSTRSGIAPHYAERYEKRGVQVDDLFERERFELRVAAALEHTNLRLQHTYGQPPLDARTIADEQLRCLPWLGPLACDTGRLLHDAMQAGRKILFEGQLGALRDPDLGIYPYTTSSSPLANFALVGAGLPARALTRVVAVTKAYSSCVGAGPFVTELDGARAQELRARGGDDGEYGRGAMDDRQLRISPPTTATQLAQLWRQLSAARAITFVLLVMACSTRSHIQHIRLSCDQNNVTKGECRLYPNSIRELETCLTMCSVRCRPKRDGRAAPPIDNISFSEMEMWMLQPEPCRIAKRACSITSAL